MDRLRAVQLRGRIVGALALTSVVTLVVAGAALLPTLEQRLRRESLTSIASAAAEARPSFDALPRRSVRPGSPRLAALARALHRRTGGQVAVVDARGRTLFSTDPDALPPLDLIERALRRGRSARLVTEGGEGREAQVAVPLYAQGPRFAVAVRKGLRETGLAVGVVRRALVPAAAAGLMVALLLGILLATRLSRRLRRLRDAAQRVARLGPEAELPADPGRDEVGDLARAFARMQERLREQEQARRVFVSTASHELRTPLASLHLMLGMLEEDLGAEHPDLPDAREQVTRAKSQTTRLSGLAADLLDLSRADAGVPLRREPVDLAELGRSVVAEFEPRAADAGVPLKVVASAPVLAWGDPGAVVRIARILLDNALRFSPPERPVCLSAGAAAGRAELAVADEGPGVPQEERELIFERFRKGSAAGAKGGFGLGLALGRELARRMGGDLRLSEVRPKTRFALTLEPAAVPVVPVSRTIAARDGGPS